MLKSKLVTATLATSLFTVMLSTGVFAAETTWDIEKFSYDGNKYIHTYHFSDGYRVDETTPDGKTIYVPEGSVIQIEYPKNLYTIDSMNHYNDTEYYAMYPAIPMLDSKGVGYVESVIDIGEDWGTRRGLKPNTDSKTFTNGKYLVESEKYVAKSGDRMWIPSDDVQELLDTDEMYILAVDPKAPKVDASNFVYKPSNKTASSTKATLVSNTKKTTTTSNKTTTPAYSVKVNGKASTSTPIIKNGVSFVPARDFVEKSLGGKVDYNAKKGQLTVYANKKVVTFIEGSNSYYVDGVKKSLPADSKLVRKNNTLYVPVKPVCESLGFSVGYDKTSNAIIVK